MRDRLVDVDFAQRDGVLVAILEGEVDGSNADELQLAIFGRLPSDAAGLVLDIAAVSYLDSSGVHLLFDLGRRLAARRQGLRLVIGERSPTRRVLELCDVDSVAPVEGDLDAAIGALVRPRPVG